MCFVNLEIFFNLRVYGSFHKLGLSFLTGTKGEFQWPPADLRGGLCGEVRLARESVLKTLVLLLAVSHCEAD